MWSLEPSPLKDESLSSGDDLEKVTRASGPPWERKILETVGGIEEILIIEDSRWTWATSL